MKIIDFDKKGNVVRFYLGDDNEEKYWGDDWDDAPYEHNAGTVYSEFVKGHVDVAFPFDAAVLEPADDCAYNCNSPFAKQDFIRRKAPCIVVVPAYEVENNWGTPDYSKYAAAQFCERFYYGDNAETVLHCSGVVLDFVEKNQ